MTGRLAERLRDETRSLHTEVERSALMHALLRGELPVAPYCMLLRNLHAIYVALEEALQQHATHAALLPIVDPALFRSAALARDLDSLYGASWPQRIGLQPAGQLYVERLRRLRETTPALLLAHAYVRYLGDLSGGQMLKRIVAKSLQLPCGPGTAFYDFGDAQQTRALTLAFRAGLDQLEADEAHISLTVTEAQHAFELHGQLFQQLASANGLAEPVRI